MGMKCIGVDIGGTSVKIGLFETTGELLDKWEVKTRKEDGGVNILPDVAASIRKKLDEMGLDLKGYLRLFFFVSYGTQPLFRMMDIMQINIRREQPDFLLEQCVCMVDMEAGFCGKPVFFSSGPWKTAG